MADSGSARETAPTGHSPTMPSPSPDEDQTRPTSSPSPALLGGGDGAADSAVEAPSLPTEAQQPQPPFKPLFALLTNATTNTTVHPRVHYIFSDDDPSLLTAQTDGRSILVDLVPPTSDTAGAEAAGQSDPAEWSVSWASSLGADFAVTDARIAVQHGGTGGGGGGDGSDDAGLMLCVEGVEREPVDLKQQQPAVDSGGTDSGSGSGGSGAFPSPSGSGALTAGTGSGTVAVKEDLDALVEDFRRRMEVLKKVVVGSHRREDAVERQREKAEKETKDRDEDRDEEEGEEEEEEEEVHDRGKGQGTEVVELQEAG